MQQKLYSININNICFSFKTKHLFPLCKTSYMYLYSSRTLFLKLKIKYDDLACSSDTIYALKPWGAIFAVKIFLLHMDTSIETQANTHSLSREGVDFLIFTYPIWIYFFPTYNNKSYNVKTLNILNLINMNSFCWKALIILEFLILIVVCYFNALV